MLGFVVAVAAGVAVPHLMEPLARPAARAVAPWVRVEPEEIRLVAFILAMLGAGLLAELFDSGSPFWVILGGGLGYFGLRIVAAVRKAIDGRG